MPWGTWLWWRRKRLALGSVVLAVGWYAGWRCSVWRAGRSRARTRWKVGNPWRGLWMPRRMHLRHVMLEGKLCVLHVGHATRVGSEGSWRDIVVGAVPREAWWRQRRSWAAATLAGGMGHPRRAAWRVERAAWRRARRFLCHVGSAGILGRRGRLSGDNRVGFGYNKDP